MGVLGLVLRDVVAPRDDEALGVEEPDVLTGLLDGHAGVPRVGGLALDGVGDQVRDADGGLARTQEEEHFLPQGLLLAPAVGPLALGLEARRGQDPRQRHRGRAFDIVVEVGGLVRPVLPQTDWGCGAF